MKLSKWSAIILIIILSSSCKHETKHRTLYWSGSSFTINDSLKNWSFYLGYYIELSDTGNVKLMTRRMFQSPKESYRIYIPDSLKSVILDLAMNPSIFNESPRDQEHSCIYDGYTYSLRIKCDTLDKTLSFIPPDGNDLQKRLVKIMDKVRNNPIIEGKTKLDLHEYEIFTEKEILKRIGPLPEIMDTIKFTL